MRRVKELEQRQLGFTVRAHTGQRAAGRTRGSGLNGPSCLCLSAYPSLTGRRTPLHVREPRQDQQNHSSMSACVGEGETKKKTVGEG